MYAPSEYRSCSSLVVACSVLCDALDDSDDRSQADKDVNAQEAPGFTPGFASVLAVVSLLGAAMLGRRKED